MSNSKTSNINIKVGMDDEKLPKTINWSADDSLVNADHEAKAMMLAFWDGEKKEALRVDLWTTEMQVHEMNHFFFQSIMAMGDAYFRATGNEDLQRKFKIFAQDFGLGAGVLKEKDS